MDKNNLEIKKLEQVTIEFAVNSIIWLDKSGRIRHVNNAACEMLGYDYDTLTSKYIFEIDPNTNPDSFENEYLSTIRKKGKYSFESFLIKKNGQKIPFEVTVFHAKQGKTDLFCSFFFDISLRKEMMEKAVESEEIIRAIFNNHFQLTGLLDLEGRLLMANQTALDLIGVSEKDIIGSYFWESPWFTHSTKLQKKIKNYVGKASKGEFIRTEFVLIDRDGIKHIFDHSFKPIMDSDGKIRFIVPEARDITDMREAEKKLQKAYNELEELKDNLQDENIYLKEELRGSHKHTNLVGQSPAFKNVMFQIEQVAETNSTVLILGETGTGKELVAHRIHALSSRRDRTMVKLNCAAIPSTLIESELFGHEKGAFTGAHMRKIGKFELADKGSIFLDEIGELSLDLQVKLLRVIQESEFERIGGSKHIKVDIRIIAATNRDLKTMIKKGLFREDLFYRLHVFPVNIPPLRERQEDIPILSDFLITQISKKIGKKIKKIPKDVLRKLQNYKWPGNIRELINVLERSAVLSQDNTLHLGEWFNVENEGSTSSPITKNDSMTLDDIQRIHIIHVLKKTKGRVRGSKGASAILGLKPTTLESRMKKLNINKSDILD